MLKTKRLKWTLPKGMTLEEIEEMYNSRSKKNSNDSADTICTTL